LKKRSAKAVSGGHGKEINGDDSFSFTRWATENPRRFNVLGLSRRQNIVLGVGAILRIVLSWFAESKESFVHSSRRIRIRIRVSLCCAVKKPFGSLSLSLRPPPPWRRLASYYAALLAAWPDRSAFGAAPSFCGRRRERRKD